MKALSIIIVLSFVSMSHNQANAQTTADTGHVQRCEWFFPARFACNFADSSLRSEIHQRNLELDSLNKKDCFPPFEGLDSVDSLEIIVVNRQGELLYQHDSTHQSWICNSDSDWYYPEGTYYCVVRGIKREKTFKYSGTLMILHK